VATPAPVRLPGMVVILQHKRRMTMNIAHLLDNLFTHPQLAVIIVFLVLLLLHLPYRYEYRCNAHGQEYGVWQSVMYRYSYDSVG
jgi:hypothetical protein